MVEVFVSRIGRDSVSNSYVVVLQEKHGSRILPIWIGRMEADSITRQIHNIIDPRPLTHDLFRSLVVAMNARLTAVNITRVEDRTYIAELHLEHAGAILAIDARPSDSIAIALRLDAPIFAADELLVDAGDEEEADEDDAPDFSQQDPSDAATGADHAELSSEQLKRYLENLRPEDFGKFNP